MSVREDKVNLIITINGDKARHELTSLDKEARQLKQEMNGLNKESLEYTEKSKRLTEVQARMKELRSEIGLSSKTLKELNQELRSLQSARQYIQPGTDAFKQNEAAIKAVRGRITELNAGIKDTGGVMNAIKNEIRQFGMIAAGYLGFQFLSTQISNIIGKAGKLSDQLADVAKTTGMTKDEVAELNKELGRIDTRTSTTELRNIAVVAGQLGIAKEEVKGFVESIDRANVALGDEFTGGAEQVAQTLGKLRNVLSDVKTDAVDQDLLHIGNALNELGAAGAATGPVVADFANRIGGVGITLGLSTSQVLGLSATLQELNVNTERGGTAVVRILQKMTTDTGTFAKVAGMDVATFTNLVNTDLYGALQKVVEGVNSGGASATAFAGALNELGVDGAGASEVFSKLAGNLPLLQDKVDLAGKSIKETTSITNEFAIKNETLGARLDKLGKQFFAMATSEGVKNFLSGAVDKVSDFLAWLSKLPAFVEQNAAALRLMGEAFLLYNGTIIAATASSWLNTTAELARKAAYEIGYRWMILKEAATKAYTLATSVLTGQITFAAAAQRAWNAVMLVNPVGLIVAGMLALVEAIDLYRSNTSEAIKLEKDKLNLSKELDTTQKNLTGSIAEYGKQIEKLNQLTPVQREELQKGIEAKLRDAQATLAQIEVQKEQIRQSATQVGTWEAIWNSMINFSNPAAAAVASASDAVKNGTEAASKYDDKIKSLKDTIGQLSGQNDKLTEVQTAYSRAMEINTLTTEQYNEKLRLLRLALSNSVVGSQEFLNISKEIKDTQEELAKKTGGSPVDDEELQKSIDKLKELQDTLKKAEFDILQDTRGKFERDVATINRKYDELLEKAKGHTAEEKKVQQLRNSELTSLENDFNKEVGTLRDQLYFSRLSKEEQELESIRAKYDQKIADYVGFNEKIKELEDLRDAELEAKKIQQESKRLADKIALEDQIWLLTLSSNDREVAEEATKWDDLIMQAEQHGLDSTSLYTLKSNAIEAITKRHNDNEKKSNKEKNDAIVAADRKRWEATAQITSAFLGAIGGMLSAFGAKQATMLQFEKMVTIAQIAIDTAAAVSSAIKNATKSSATTFDMVLNISMGVAAVFSAIAQAKSLLSSANVPSPPAMKTGGKLPGGVVLPGPDVSDDNLHVVDPVTGQVVAKVKSGEPVLSTETYANNKPIVDQLLDSSMNKGGASIIPKFNDGGIIDMPLTDPLQPNMENMLRSLRIAQFGPVASGSSNNINAPSGAGKEGGVNFELLLAEHRAEIAELMRQHQERLEQMEIKGVWDWDYYSRTKSRMSELEQNSRVG